MLEKELIKKLAENLRQKLLFVEENKRIRGRMIDLIVKTDTGKTSLIELKRRVGIPDILRVASVAREVGEKAIGIIITMDKPPTIIKELAKKYNIIIMQTPKNS